MHREWTRLDELKIGDRVAIVRGFTCQLKNYVSTGFVSFGEKQKNVVNLPATVTPSFAALLGYALGDGGVDQYRLTLYVVETEKDLLPLLQEKIQKNFAISPEIYERKAETDN
jgi:hypothetical protein